MRKRKYNPDDKIEEIKTEDIDATLELSKEGEQLSDIKKKRTIRKFKLRLIDKKISIRLAKITTVAFVNVFERWRQNLLIEAERKEGITEEDKRAGRKAKANTHKTYSSRIIYFLEWLITDGIQSDPLTMKKPNDDSGAMEFREWIGTKVKNARYINQILITVRSLYDYIVAAKPSVPYNPFVSIKGYREDRTTLRKFLTTDEQTKILTFIANKNERYYIATLLGMFAGLRLSEAVGVKKRDIITRKRGDIDDLYITVVGKGNVTRNALIMNDNAKKIIIDYNKGFRDDDYLVYGSLDAKEHMSEHVLANMMTRVSKHLDIDFSFHSFRHTFATDLANDGVKIEVLRYYLGHKSIATTLIYAQINEDTALKEILDRGIIK